MFVEVIVHTEVSNELSADETKNKEIVLETSEKLMEISEDISENVNVETKVQSALIETKESVASVETELGKVNLFILISIFVCEISFHL